MRRSSKYRWVTRLERCHNRAAVAALRRGWGPRAYSLLETTGRRSGEPRVTPVGESLDGDTFWLVAFHGRQSDWVLNLLAEPRVRVKIRGRWRRGTATVVPGDDAVARSRTLPHQWDKAIGRALAMAPLTVRVALEPSDQGR